MSDRLQKLEALWAWLRGGPDDIADIDRGDLQDKAIELGLLREVPYDPAIHGKYAEYEFDLKAGDPFIEVVKA